ncbi:MAG: chloride channel protein [Phycisphaerales bacterium]|jgi:H+/Cl- antiporter ClcA
MKPEAPDRPSLGLVTLAVTATCAAALLAGVAGGFLKMVEPWGDAWIGFLRGEHDLAGFAPAPWVRWTLGALGVTGAITAGMVLVQRVFVNANGTGIPQAMAAVAIQPGPARGRVLSGWLAFGKSLLLIVGILAGLTIGREGPTVHLAACLFWLLWTRVPMPRNWARTGLLTAAGAAGIAAAFNTPIAGLIFAIEEMSRRFNKADAPLLFRSALLSTAAVFAVGWFVPNLGGEPGVLIRSYDDAMFYGPIAPPLPLADSNFFGQAAALLVLAIPAGILGGLFAVAVARSASFVGQTMARRRQSVWIFGIGLGLILSIVMLASGGLSMGSGHGQTLRMLHGEFDPPSWFSLPKALGSWACLASGVPGGLFDPSLTVGAGIGHVLHAPLEGVIGTIDARLLILVMMAAYFGGVTQSPITAAVICAEMTGGWSLLLILGPAALAASAASRLVCPIPLYLWLSQSFLRLLMNEPNAAIDRGEAADLDLPPIPEVEAALDGASTEPAWMTVDEQRTAR